MKLTSEPKPVKIRIVSGGEEHSSLDSLRQNFCVSDLQKIESQLTQWLNRQGKEGEDIVQELEKIPTSLGNCNSEDYLLVYKVFFKDILPSSSIKTLGDVYKWFDHNAHKYRKNLKSLHQILWGEDEEYTLSVINQKENITEEMISKLRKEDSAQAHFLLGVYYAEIGNYTHLGVNLLRKAKKEGHKGAKRYLEEHNHVANPIIKWPDINISFMKDYIDDVIKGKSSVFAVQHKWTTNEDTVCKFVLYCLSLGRKKYSSYDDIFLNFHHTWRIIDIESSNLVKEMAKNVVFCCSPVISFGLSTLFGILETEVPTKETTELPTKEIIELAKNGDAGACMELSIRYKRGTALLQKDAEKAEYWKNKAIEISKHSIDILYNEILFIQSLIGLKTKKYENPSKQVLEELSNSYYPAKYILNDKEIHPILDDVKFRKQPLFKQIEILLINLFEF